MTAGNILTVNIIDDQNLLDRFSKDIKHKRKIIATLKSTCRKILVDSNICRGRLNIVITDDKTMQKYNVKFLGHDYVTDVISFQINYKESRKKNKNVEKYLEGDILVCADVAIDRSSEFALLPLEELILYAIHGTLHLAGYDDKNKNSRKIMQQKESEYLQIFRNNFVPIVQ